MGAFPSLGGTAITFGTFLAGLGLQSAFPGSQPIPFTIEDKTGKTVITFGDSANSPTEIPQRLSALGGEQMHAIHVFPGGLRTIQALGPLPLRITWSGILYGGNAFSRSYAIDRLRVAGDFVFITYGPWKWLGLIVSYKAVPRHQNIVDYTVEFEPSQDLTSTVKDLTAASPDSILSDFETTLENAITGATGLSASTLAAVAAILPAVGALALANAGTIEGVTESSSAPVKTQIASVRATLDTARNDPTNLAGAASAAAMIPPLDGISGLLPAAPAVQTTVQTVNPNLPVEASKWMGDPSLWPQLAQANGMTDPAQSGVKTLIVPKAVGAP